MGPSGYGRPRGLAGLLSGLVQGGASFLQGRQQAQDRQRQIDLQKQQADFQRQQMGLQRQRFGQDQAEFDYRKQQDAQAQGQHARDAEAGLWGPIVVGSEHQDKGLPYLSGLRTGTRQPGDFGQVGPQMPNFLKSALFGGGPEHGAVPMMDAPPGAQGGITPAHAQTAPEFLQGLGKLAPDLQAARDAQEAAQKQKYALEQINARGVQDTLKESQRAKTRTLATAISTNARLVSAHEARVTRDAEYLETNGLSHQEAWAKANAQNPGPKLVDPDELFQRLGLTSAGGVPAPSAAPTGHAAPGFPELPEGADPEAAIRAILGGLENHPLLQGDAPAAAPTAQPNLNLPPWLGSALQSGALGPLGQLAGQAPAPRVPPQAPTAPAAAGAPPAAPGAGMLPAVAAKLGLTQARTADTLARPADRAARTGAVLQNADTNAGRLDLSRMTLAERQQHDRATEAVARQNSQYRGALTEAQINNLTRRANTIASSSKVSPVVKEEMRTLRDSLRQTISDRRREESNIPFLGSDPVKLDEAKKRIKDLNDQAAAIGTQINQKAADFQPAPPTAPASSRSSTTELQAVLAQRAIEEQNLRYASAASKSAYQQKIDALDEKARRLAGAAPARRGSGYTPAQQAYLRDLNNTNATPAEKKRAFESNFPGVPYR